MKILYYAWGAFNDEICIQMLKKQGHEIEQITNRCENYTRDMKLAAEFMLRINTSNFDCVFSFDYFPIISMVCNISGIPYYSWVYDSPHKTLQAKCINLACNHISVFDKKYVKRINEAGINTVKHLPLASDSSFFYNTIKNCGKRFQCDVSFVGSLYTDSYNYYELLKNPDQIWTEIDKLVNKQAFEYKLDY